MFCDSFSSLARRRWHNYTHTHTTNWQPFVTQLHMPHTTKLRSTPSILTVIYLSCEISKTKIHYLHSVSSHRDFSDEVLAWLSVWSEVQMTCIWSSWCHCHLIISCFIKIQIGLTFLVPAYPGGKEAVKWHFLLFFVWSTNESDVHCELEAAMTPVKTHVST